MRTTFTAALLCLALTACGGSGPTSGNSGPVRFGLTNNRQSAETGAARFGAPVVGKAVRVQTASGWKIQLVSPLYADTGVIGAPAAGVRACFRVDDQANNGGPLPDAPCKVTGPDGLVSFVFTAGTKPGRYVNTACAFQGETCVDGDSAVLVVTPRLPVASRYRVGFTETRGTSVGDTLAFMERDLFTDVAGETAAFRVEGTGWLQTVGGEPGSRSGRLLVANWRDRAVGDTATVRFYSPTKEIAVAQARIDVILRPVPGNNEGGASIRLTFTSVSVP